jgi:predicted dehydrogenase
MIRIGIVGSGGMGTVHYSNYGYIPDCQVAALTDVGPRGEARAREWGVPFYESIPAMVEAQNLDVVDVCSPTFLHKTHVEQALRAGVHAITEKPAALHLSDVQEMFDLADKQGRQIYVGQVLQFTKEVEVLRGLVQSGEYGRPLDAFFERLSARPRWVQNDWLFDRQKSGLLPFDLHIHDLDVIVSLFGRPLSYSFTASHSSERAFPEHYRFLYEFDGLHVSAEAAWYNADFPFTARWRVYFENAVVVNDGSNVTAYQFDQPPRIFDTQDLPKIPTGINLPPTGMFKAELSHFVDCIQSNRPSDKVTRQQVLTVIGLLEEITAGS